MYRVTLFAAMMGSSLLNGYAAAAITSRPGQETSDPSRILNILDFGDPKDHADRLHTKELEQLGAIAFAFRNQFKDVLEELIIQVFKYLRSTFHDLKLRLFKRLGRYTLSDLFHATFDGVADFVIDSSTDAGLAVRPEQEPSRHGYGYSHYPYVPPHPYAFRSEGIIMKKLTDLKEFFKESLRLFSGRSGTKEDKSPSKYNVGLNPSNTESPSTLVIMSGSNDHGKNKTESDIMERKPLLELHKTEDHLDTRNVSNPQQSDEKEKLLLSFLPHIRDMNEQETQALKMEITALIFKIKRIGASNFYFHSATSSKISASRSNIRTTTLSTPPAASTANSVSRGQADIPELILIER